MKRLLACLLLLSLLVISLSACGSKEEATPTAPSSTPLNVQLLAEPGSNAVTLDWKMVSEGATYNIYWIEDAGNTYSTANPPGSAIMKAGHSITGLPSATYTVHGLTNGTTYWFALSASYGTDETSLTIAVATQPSDTPQLAPPENVRANAIGTNAVTVTWDEVSGASAYKVYNYTFFEGQFDDTVTGLSNTSFNVTGLTTNTIYTFWVRAVDASNVLGLASFLVKATPGANLPPVGPVLKVANTGTSSTEQIILAWNAPASNTGDVTYTIYYGTAKGITKNTGKAQAVGDALAVYVKNLTSGIKYYFVVTATDDNGESAESNEKSAVAY